MIIEWIYTSRPWKLMDKKEARKTYTCDICGSLIHKKEIYYSKGRRKAHLNCGNKENKDLK